MLYESAYCKQRIVLIQFILLMSWHYVFLSMQCPCVLPGFDSSLKLFHHKDQQLQICVESKDTLDQLRKIEQVYTQNGSSSATKFVSVFAHPSFKLIPIEKNGPQTSCDVLLNIPSDPISQFLSERRLCPDQCAPVPVARIPEALFLPPSIPSEYEFAVTCTLTFQREIMHKWVKYKRNLLEFYGSWYVFLLHEVTQRRYFECHETAALYRYAFPRNLSPFINDSTNVFSSASTPPTHAASSSSSSNSMKFKPVTTITPTQKRRIHGMVLWIGTTAKYSLMESQALSLLRQPFHNEDAIIGWTATDGLYPCRPEGIKCHGGHKKYQGLLPQSNINFMPAGWACAQRRPLRALAHVLLFYSIQSFLLLLDDDTFFNFDLFQRKYLSSALSSSSFFSTYAAGSTLYFGEALGKTGNDGHLSKEGFFVGGSGYILSRRILEKLVTKESIYFGLEGLQQGGARHQEWMQWIQRNDPYRSPKHMKLLSLVGEGLDYSQRYCSVFQEPGPGQPPVDKRFACIASGSLLNPPAGQEEMIRWMNQTAEEIERQKYSLQHDFSEKFVRIPLGLRLIDFCTNLMANENTCQHR
jgi:hypothetical protein